MMEVEMSMRNFWINGSVGCWEEVLRSNQNNTPPPNKHLQNYDWIDDALKKQMQKTMKYHNMAIIDLW